MIKIFPMERVSIEEFLENYGLELHVLERGKGWHTRLTKDGERIDTNVLSFTDEDPPKSPNEAVDTFCRRYAGASLAYKTGETETKQRVVEGFFGVPRYEEVVVPRRLHISVPKLYRTKDYNKELDNET